MRLFAHRRLEKYRIKTGRLASDETFGNNGAFFIPLKGDTLAVIVSDQDGWDHVSVSLQKRCPSWNEMCFVKDLFFDPEEAVMQLHPPASTYINCHEYRLHLWRPQEKRIPMPPTYMVGPMANKQTV